MHSSHLNHQYNTHPSSHHHHQQQQHSGGCNTVAVDDKCEMMRPGMKPPHHHHGTVSTSTTTSFVQPNKSSYHDGVVKHPAQKPSAIVSNGTSPYDGVRVHQHENATIDDFDIMLLHEDFPHLLMIAAKVKSTHRTIAKILNPPEADGSNEGNHLHAWTQPPFQPISTGTYRPKNALLPDEVLRAVERMQQVLIQKKPSDKSVIPRGHYPITDSLMEDAMIVLQEDYDYGRNWLVQHEQTTKPVASAETLVSVSFDAASNFYGKRNRNDMLLSSDNSSNTATGGPITIKYAKWQTDALMNWMIENKDQPFPDSDAIELLVQQTGLTSSQIVNWTTNVRKRNRKATCENGKKPHHFLDFLFLVHDRESKKANASSAAAFTGKFIDTKNHQEESRMMYGESPRMIPTVSQFGSSMHATSVPTNNSGASIPPVEHFLPRPSPRGQNIHASSNRFAVDDIYTDNIYTIGHTVDDVNHPIPLTAQSNDEIMVDFADCWLNENCYYDTEVSHARSFVPMIDRHGGNILHSVTDDSHDDGIASGRNDELSLANLLDDDDMLIDEWASYAQSLF